MASSALGSIVAAERRNSEPSLNAFMRMTSGKPYVAEWQLPMVAHIDLAGVVIERGRAVDLIVSGQTDPEWDLSPLLDFPERLALEMMDAISRACVASSSPGRRRARQHARYRRVTLVAGGAGGPIKERGEDDTASAGRVNRWGAEPSRHQARSANVNGVGYQCWR